jgi:hypothetical protein
MGCAGAALCRMSIKVSRHGPRLVIVVSAFKVVMHIHIHGCMQSSLLHDVRRLLKILHTPLCRSTVFITTVTGNHAKLCIRVAMSVMLNSGLEVRPSPAPRYRYLWVATTGIVRVPTSGTPAQSPPLRDGHRTQEVTNTSQTAAMALNSCY